jgi:predicted DNA binding CopG/RHH family protein
MSKYLKSEPGYEETEFDASKIESAMKKHKKERKQPTSVALDPGLIKSLKIEAHKRGVPYQILMRMFIVDRFERMLRTA